MGQPHAHLTVIAPESALALPHGLRMLDALSHAAGERRAHHLIAEVDEDSPAFECLRRAGFAIYARQRVWSLQRELDVDLQPLDAAWRLEVGSDTPAIRSLFVDLVPAMVQQVEPPPPHKHRNLVHWTENQLLGFMDIERGPRGTWAQPYFHPAAQIEDELLAGFVQHLHPNPKTPLYICVRSYQAGLRGSLERLGFNPVCDQAVMVKRLTAAIRREVHAPLRALEGTQPEPTAPFAPVRSRAEPGGPKA
jgi:hypothetical protein